MVPGVGGGGMGAVPDELHDAGPGVAIGGGACFRRERTATATMARTTTTPMTAQ